MEAKRNVVWIALIGVAALLAAVSLFFLFSNPRKSYAYTIPGVPYYGIYTLQKADRPRYIGSVDSSLLSILDYWGYRADYDQKKIAAMPTDTKTGAIHLENIAAFLDSSFPEFSTSVENLSLEELAKYLNADARTPLLVFIPSGSTKLFLPSVLIGMDEVRGMVVVHNYWLGNNYELPFGSFAHLGAQGGGRGTAKVQALIFQPKNVNAIARSMSIKDAEVYPKRTEITERATAMYMNYAIALAQMKSDPQAALDYFSKIEFDRDFAANFPPYSKATLWTNMSKLYRQLKKLDLAVGYAHKAMNADHDLDRPFGSWPGVYILRNTPGNQGRLYTPYAALGDALKDKNDLAGAQRAYDEAKKIFAAFSR